MMARAQIWWTVLQMCIAERLAYRGDFIIGTTMRFLPIITQIFLWTAVFGAATGNRLAGYTRNDVVAYYLLTMVARAFSSMPGLAGTTARQIRDGEIKKFLIQPIDFTMFTLLSRMGHKLVYYAVALLPFGAVFWLCGDFFPPFPPLEVFAAFVVSLALGFAVGFFMEFSLGLIGFWMLEVSSLLFIYMLFSFFVSGHMFPLDILPQPWRDIVYYLPLKYLAYFPAAVYLQKIPADHLWHDLGIGAAWAGFFMVFSRWLLKRGFDRYSGYGG